MVLIEAAFAPVVPFERSDAGTYSPLADIRALPILAPPTAGPTSMGVQTNDVTSFSQTGQIWVPRGSDLRAGDRFTWQARKYALMGVPSWDMDHPFTGDDLGWMEFTFQVDPAQLIADLLALRGQLITLIPAVGVVTAKAGGGHDYSAASARDPQMFVLFKVSSPETGRLGKGFESGDSSSKDGGIVRTFHYNMIGAAGAVIELGDKWEDDIATYTVESVDNTQPYQVGAVAAAYLKVQGHAYAG